MRLSFSALILAPLILCLCEVSCRTVEATGNRSHTRTPMPLTVSTTASHASSSSSSSTAVSIAPPPATTTAIATAATTTTVLRFNDNSTLLYVRVSTSLASGTPDRIASVAKIDVGLLIVVSTTAEKALDGSGVDSTTTIVALDVTGRSAKQIRDRILHWPYEERADAKVLGIFPTMPDPLTNSPPPAPAPPSMLLTVVLPVLVGAIIITVVTFFLWRRKNRHIGRVAHAEYIQMTVGNRENGGSGLSSDRLGAAPSLPSLRSLMGARARGTGSEVRLEYSPVSNSDGRGRSGGDADMAVASSSSVVTASSKKGAERQTHKQFELKRGSIQTDEI